MCARAGNSKGVSCKRLEAAANSPASLRIQRSLIGALALAALGACGGGGDSQGPDAGSGEHRAMVLSVLPETFLDGGTAEAIHLDPRWQGGELVVGIQAKAAHNLKALYIALDYNPVELHPVGAGASPAFDHGGQALSLSVSDPAGEPGRLYYGQVLARYQEHHGYSGSGALALLRFAPGPQTAKAALTPPTNAGAACDLSYDPATLELAWYYHNLGDCDQNGEVNIADLTPLGQHFGETSGAALDPFLEEDALSCIDGDGNGEINIADITPIGLGFGNSVASFGIYRSSTSADYPGSNNTPNGTSGMLTSDALPFSQVPAPGERKRFVYTFAPNTPPLTSDWMWIRPQDGNQAEGTPSRIVNGAGGYPPFNPQYPVAVLTVAPLAGTAPLTVHCDASSSYDSGGALVDFIWDFDGDGDSDDAAELGARGQSSVDHTFNTAGVFNTRVTVLDGDGHGANDSQLVQVNLAGSNQAPVAMLTADPPAGGSNVVFTFDAQASSDPDGSIVDYNWDLNGNGEFSTAFDHERDYDGASEALLWPDEGGAYTVNVRVTDNAGAQAIATLTLTVEPAWNIESPLPASGDDRGRMNSLTALNGQYPAIAYWNETQRTLQMAVRVASSVPDWSYIQTVDDSGAVGDPAAEYSEVSLCQVAGRPAVAYHRDGGLYFARASSFFGLAWDAPGPTRLDDGFHNAGQACKLAVLDGFPAVAYYEADTDSLWCMTANSFDGQAWFPPHSVKVADEGGRRLDLRMCNGVPCVSYYSTLFNAPLFASRNGGGTWDSTGVGPGSTGHGGISMLATAPGGGTPPIVCAGAGGDYCYFAAPADGTFPAWGLASAVAPGVSPSMAYTWDGLFGRYFVCSYDPASGSLNCSTTVLGSGFWADAAPVDSVAAYPSAGHSSTSMAVIGGRPCVSYYDASSRTLEFAMYR